MKIITMVLLATSVLISLVINAFLITMLISRKRVKPKTEIEGKTLIELLVMAEDMAENDKLIHICKLIRTMDIQNIEPWQAEGYANIIKKELRKLEHVFKI